MTYRMRLPSFLKGVCSAALLLLVTWSALPCLAQPQRPLDNPRQQDQDKQQQEAWELQRKQELIKKENLKRQQEIKKDTDALLALATELKQYVDKTNENTLSLDVIKKAEQIEKLAKTVREKMKGPS